MRIPFVNGKLVLFLAICVIFCTFSGEKHAYFEPKNDQKHTISDEKIISSYLIAHQSELDEDYDFAIKNYNKIMPYLSDNSAVLDRVMLINLFAGNVRDAAEYARLLLAIDDFAVHAKFVLGIQCIKEKNYQKSAQIFDEIRSQKIIENSKIDSLIIPMLSLWSYVGLGDFEVANKILDSIKEKVGKDSHFANYYTALFYEMDKKYKLAKIYYENILQESDIPTRSLQNILAFYNVIGDVDASKKIIDGYKKSDDRYRLMKNDYIRGELTVEFCIAELFADLVSVLQGSDMENEAIPYLRIISYLRPNMHQSEILIAHYFEKKDKYKKAYEIYNKIPKNSIYYTQSRINMAYDLYFSNERVDAYGELRDLYNASSTNKQDVYFATGDFYRNDKDYESAAKYYTSALQSSKELYEKKNAYFARAICFERMGNWKSAQEDLLQSLKIDFDQPRVMNYLAYNWIVRGVNEDKAYQILRAAFKQDPGDPYILDSLGWAYFKRGKDDAAMTLINHAINKKGDSADFYDHLGDIYLKKKMPEHARHQWRRAVEFADDVQSVSKIEKKILKNY